MFHKTVGFYELKLHGGVYESLIFLEMDFLKLGFDAFKFKLYVVKLLNTIYIFMF